MDKDYDRHKHLSRATWLYIFGNNTEMSKADIVYRIAVWRRSIKKDPVPEYSVSKWIGFAISDNILKKKYNKNGKYVILPLNAAKEQTLNFDNLD